MASQVFGQTQSSAGHDTTTPRIIRLELLTAAPLASMKEFYHRLIGLPVLDDAPGRLTLAAGLTHLTFVPASPADGQPFYHFAFNIPQNKILQARTWQRQGTPLLPIPVRLRDPRYPDDIVDYRHWNAHSIFFFDPAANVVEYIARHDLANAAAGPFSTRDILYASEIGLVVDDVPNVASTIRTALRLAYYRGANDQLTAMGDESGLVLVIKRGRILSFDSKQRKAAAVFGTKAALRGTERMSYRFDTFPYEVRLEA
jgi:hypothetical protein